MQHTCGIRREKFENKIKMKKDIADSDFKGES